MKDTSALADTVSVESFKTTLIISEILITAIVLYGFYVIFNRFNKKNKEFIEQNKKENKG
jgi:hypothetical protein